MPTLFQINCDSNWGSTGRIAEQIGQLAIDNGWESHIAFGRDSNPSVNNTIRIGNKFQVYEHYLENILFDREGLSSRFATRNLIHHIDRIQPDVIQLHNIHDHWLNYPLLFEYLSKISTPVVWTMHDCWSFTGGCAYFSVNNCYQWQTKCTKCPMHRIFGKSNTKRNFNTKKRYFSALPNLTIVPVSQWLADITRKSFLSKYKIFPILNGIDVDIFKPMDSSHIRQKYQFGNKHILLGVASTWSSRKGLQDYIKLANIIDEDCIIVLVGINEKQSKLLPNNIIPIKRTDNIQELALLYNCASIVLNLSYEETFGLTTVEGLACGTPGIVYNCTASPELITNETGRIMDGGDVEGVADAIRRLIKIGKNNMSDACRERAITNYDKNKCFDKYLCLYNSLLTTK